MEAGEAPSKKARKSKTQETLRGFKSGAHPLFSFYDAVSLIPCAAEHTTIPGNELSTVASAVSCPRLLATPHAVDSPLRQPLLRLVPALVNEPIEGQPSDQPLLELSPCALLAVGLLMEEHIKQLHAHSTPTGSSPALLLSAV